MRALVILLLVFVVSATARSQTENNWETYNELGWSSLRSAVQRDSLLRAPTPEGYGKAINYFERAILQGCNSADSYLGLAVAHNRLQQYEQALTAIQHAVEIEPNQAGARNELGIALYGLCRYKEAIASLEEEIRINDDYLRGLRERPKEGYLPISSNFINHLTLGHMHSQLGQLQRAKEEYNYAIGLNPTDPMAHFSIGLAFLGLGEREAAWYEYRVLVSLCSSDGLKEKLLEELER